MINIDGSYGEGGGQIIRTALALSTLTSKPFKATNIRSGKPNPGLKAQHVSCIKVLKELCNAKSTGVESGSKTLEYFPGKYMGKSLNHNIGTAGSITLMLQSLLIPMMFGDKKTKLKITGGTDVSWSMPIDYFNNLLIPEISKYALIKSKVVKRGYYPKGQGEVEINIEPIHNRQSFKTFKEFKQYLVNLKQPIVLVKNSKLVYLKGISNASKDLEGRQLAERQANNAKLLLMKYNLPVNIRSEYTNTYSTGSSLTLWGIYSNGHQYRVGADALGNMVKKAEDVAKEAVKNLDFEILSKATVDKHLADNLIPFIALFGGSIKVSEVTNHTLTNIFITEQFLDVKFKVENNIISLEPIN